MGVTGLMPLIKNGGKTNTSLKQMIRKYPTKDTIGIGMSILLIQAIKGSPNIISQLFTIPNQPIDELNDKVCEKVKVYVENGFNIVCVFDGLPGPLKQNNVYLSRYGKNDELKNQLIELYSKDITNFDDQKLQEFITDVNDIRKTLATFNQADLLHSLKKKLYETFKEKVFCIGAAFEADHQLASLFQQNVIDYVYTNDSDLTVLGVDVILNTNVRNGNCFLRTFDDFLLNCLPKGNLQEGEKWSVGTLHHAVCFLGNDFVKQNPGNSFKKLEAFMTNITAEHGNLRDDDEVFGYIYNTALIPSNCSAAEKATWDNDKKLAHIKKWKEGMAMFLYGPTFTIIPTGGRDISAKQSLRTRTFKVKLTPMNGDVNKSWLIDESQQTQFDKLCNRTMLVDFNPEEVLKDKLACRDEFKDNQSCNNIFDALLYKIFSLKVWSKTAEDIDALPEQCDRDGNEYFHGSILDFDTVPIILHSYDQLKMWLQTRQIKVPPTFHETTKLVSTIWNSLGKTHKPIIKSMMRGSNTSSGYCAPELLSVKESSNNVSYSKGDEALLLIRDIFPNFNDDQFSSYFGKRNGTRKRILMHIRGGSYDIKQLKITSDLMRNDNQILI